MTGFLVGLFTTPLDLTGRGRFVLMLPLCLGIAIVYKALRSDDLRRMPRAVLSLWATIVAGMCAVGVGLWLLYELMA